MTVIIQEVYNAFKEAGVKEETARDAAEALSGYSNKFYELEREIENRFNKLEREIDQRFNKIDIEIAEIKGTLKLHQWMIGFQLVLTTAILFLLLRGGL
jgi:hypothetical protein